MHVYTCTGCDQRLLLSSGMREKKQNLSKCCCDSSENRVQKSTQQSSVQLLLTEGTRATARAVYTAVPGPDLSRVTTSGRGIWEQDNERATKVFIPVSKTDQSSTEPTLLCCSSRIRQKREGSILAKQTASGKNVVVYGVYDNSYAKYASTRQSQSFVAEPNQIQVFSPVRCFFTRQ